MSGKVDAMPTLPQVQNLFYITHIENIGSILRHGILSHSRVEELGVPSSAIYDQDIVNNRLHRYTIHGKSLWDYANLYFQPRNPMLYRVIHGCDPMDVAILAVKPQVLGLDGVLVTSGNAASPISDIVEVASAKDMLSGIWEVIQSDWWKEEDGTKRQIMAECLVPEYVPSEMIDAVYVVSATTAERLHGLVPDVRIPIIPEPHMFFQPLDRIRLTDKLSLINGDMFFSQMHTLTISVNTVGVMGKGLASRVRYQFPDVYVYYQDLCRKKILKMGLPYVYKRETSFGRQLADEPDRLPEIGADKWFLLFPTKRHWRDDSDITGIEQGLRWLQDRYRDEQIESLAVPALGCGLGNLTWKQVGPLMCSYLSDLDIQVAIYLPRERQVPHNQLTCQFLLGV